MGQPSESESASWYRHSILNSGLSETQTIELAFGNHQPREVLTLLHAKQNRLGVLLAPLFASLVALLVVQVAILGELQYALVIEERESQYRVIVLARCDFVALYNLSPDSSAGHVVDCLLVRQDHALGLWHGLEHFNRLGLQLIVKVSGQLNKVSVVVTGGSEALEGASFEIDRERVTVSVVPTLAFGTDSEEQLIALLVGGRAHYGSKAINILSLHRVAHWFLHASYWASVIPRCPQGVCASSAADDEGFSRTHARSLSSLYSLYSLIVAL